MGDSVPFSPKSVKVVRLDVLQKKDEPSIQVEPVISPLRQTLQLNTESLSPTKSVSNLKQSFYRALTPKSSTNSPLMLMSSSSYRSPVKSLRRKPSLRCESLEESSNHSRLTANRTSGSILHTKSFTYGYSWNGSDSDLSQLSSNNVHTFHFMNTMQQSLGVMLTASPLMILIASLRTSTRDSFDNGSSKPVGINITSSVESINYSGSNTTAVEVGDIHLDLLRKACVEQVNAIIADLQAYNTEAMNQALHESSLAVPSNDENQQRLQPNLSESIIRASLDENHIIQQDHTEEVNTSLFGEKEDQPTPQKEEEENNEIGIKKVMSNESEFSLGFNDPAHQLYDDSSESTVNNNVSRHSSTAMMNITPSISNAASEDFADEHYSDPHIIPIQHDPNQLKSNLMEDHLEEQIRQEQSKSGESGLPPPSSHSRTRSHTSGHSQPFFQQSSTGIGSSEALYTEIDLGIHEYSTILYRYIDLSCTHSEILQLQNQEDQAINSLIHTFYYTNIFVNKYLSDWETLLLFASLDDDDNHHNLEFNENIMKNMDQVFQQLSMDNGIDWKIDPFVNSFLYNNQNPTNFQYYTSPPMTNTNQPPTGDISELSTPPAPGLAYPNKHPSPSREYSQDMSVIINLENLCKVLSKYDHSHTLYGIAHGIRRLGVLLKCTNQLAYAYTAVQTCVHIFEVLGTIYTNPTIDLSSCYALSASILEEMNSPQSMEMDRKGLEISSVGKSQYS